MTNRKVKNGESLARHPIRVVAQRAGLTPDVLRAWEKRYAVVEPARSETGQRLYTDSDVERLQLLRRATEGGRTIGRVAKLDPAELRALVEEDEGHRRETQRERVESASDAATEHFEQALTAVRELDAGGLDAILVKAALRLGSAVFLEHVAVPLLRQVGEMWHAEELGVAHEHMATSATQRVLGWLLWSATPNRQGPAIVIATPAGQRHELGAMLASAVASEEGWRVVYLGADLPAAEIARAVAARDADVVALSLVYPQGESRVIGELRRLRERLPAVRILVGGGAARSYSAVLSEIDAQLVPQLSDLRSALAVLRTEAASVV